MTNAETLKAQVLEIASKLLTYYETAFINSPTKRPAEDEETAIFIHQSKKAIEAFKAYKPEVYLYIEGGNLQGISASETMITEVYDKDNYDVADEEQAEELGTPEDWEAQIKALTDKNEITGIY